VADLEALRAHGLIDGQHRFRITDAGHRWAEALGPFIREMAAARSERRGQLATLLADYEIAVDAAESPDEGLEARARDAVAVRAAKLAREVAGRRRSPALVALASLGRVWAEGPVARILAEEPIDGLTSSAVALVDAWGDPSHDPALLALAGRASSPRPPNPFLRAHVVEFVLRHYRADTLPLDLRDQSA
jgi:hypothetical protein